MVFTIRTQYALRAVDWDDVKVLLELLMALSVTPGICPYGGAGVADLLRANTDDRSIPLVKLEDVLMFIATKVRVEVGEPRKSPKKRTGYVLEGREEYVVDA